MTSGFKALVEVDMFYITKLKEIFEIPKKLWVIIPESL